MAKIIVNGMELDPDPEKLLNVEFIAIERATQGRLTLNAFAAAAANGSMEALTALFWVLAKRQEPTMRFDDMVFNLTDLKIVNDDGTVVEGPEALKDLQTELQGQQAGRPND